MVSRVHLQSIGNQVFDWPIEVRKQQKQRSISEHDCDFQRFERRCKMTREEAIKILEYPVKKWSMEWDEREDGLSYYEAIEMAISALRAQQEQEKNEALTLDELREAAETGDPVWLVGMEDGDGWRRIDYVELLTVGYSWFGDPERWCFRTAGYGVRVFAYRQKPEEGTR